VVKKLNWSLHSFLQLIYGKMVFELIFTTYIWLLIVSRKLEPRQEVTRVFLPLVGTVAASGPRTMEARWITGLVGWSVSFFVVFLNLFRVCVLF
jgi:hypothetical protein